MTILQGNPHIEREDSSPERAVAGRAGISIRELALPLALIVICAFFSIKTANFLSYRNLSNLAIELSITAVLALGMLLVMLPGQIDLAAGSGVGWFGAIAAALIISYGFPAWAALLLAIIAAMAVWFAMGALIVKERVPAFIITLGGLLMFRGFQEQLFLHVNNSSIPVTPGDHNNLYALMNAYCLPPVAGLVLAAIAIAAMAVFAYMNWSRRKAAGAPADGEMLFLRTIVSAQLVLMFVLICNRYQGVPAPAIVLGITAVAVSFLCNHTPFGRYLYAIGGNEEAAVVSGVPVHQVTIGAFVIMGFLVAITGFLQTAYAGYSTATIGLQMELDAVAACVIGGTSLRGGRGTVAGVLTGALIMAVLLNGMSLMGVQIEGKLIARGLVLVLAVWADVRLSRQG